MKPSNNSIGILIFTLLAAIAFFFMAKRPAVEGNALNFGMPIHTQATQTDSTASTVEATTSDVEQTTETPEPATVETTEAKEKEAVQQEEVKIAPDQNTEPKIKVEEVTPTKDTPATTSPKEESTDSVIEEINQEAAHAAKKIVAPVTETPTTD